MLKTSLSRVFSSLVGKRSKRSRRSKVLGRNRIWEAGAEVCEQRNLLSGLAMNFIPNSYEATAVSSGAWNNPAVWGGSLPQAGDDVTIPRGVRITITSRVAPAFNFINVSGQLSFRQTTNTRLIVETLRVDNGGRLLMGTSASVVRSNRVAEVVFRPNGGFDAGDTSRTGLGLLVEPTGRVVSVGTNKADFLTSHATDTRSRNSFRRNSAAIIVTGAASGWRVGDQISIAATRFERNQLQTEVARIRSLTATTVAGERGWIVQLGRDSNRSQVFRLANDHVQLPGETTHVANLTRNVVFRSETAGRTDAALVRRGHVMSHSQDVQFRNVEFRNLGRTDKTRLVEDSRDGVALRAKTGEATRVILPSTVDGHVNQRGRYSIHFHRTLEVKNAAGDFINNWSNVAIVTGSVVNGSPGWGFVSHSSGVNFIDNVSFGAVGAGFVAEAGNEIGTWRGNLALQGAGNGAFPTRVVENTGLQFPQAIRQRFTAETGETVVREQNLRVLHGDLAFTGDGFWIQSPGLNVTNNVAAGMDGRGFTVYNQGLFETDWEQEVGFRRDLINWGDRSFRVWNATNDRHEGRAIVQDLSFNEFSNNTTYASFLGLQVRFQSQQNREFTTSLTGRVRQVGRGNPSTAGSVFSGFTGIRNEQGMTTSYLTNSRFNDFTFINDGPERYALAVAAQTNIDGSIVFGNLDISGYVNGLDFQARSPRWTLINPSFDVLGGYEIRQLNTATGSGTLLLRLLDFVQSPRGTYTNVLR